LGKKVLYARLLLLKWDLTASKSAMPFVTILVPFRSLWHGTRSRPWPRLSVASVTGWGSGLGVTDWPAGVLAFSTAFYSCKVTVRAI
jgi:hypothetical protein